MRLEVGQQTLPGEESLLPSFKVSTTPYYVTYYVTWRIPPIFLLLNKFYTLYFLCQMVAYISDKQKTASADLFFEQIEWILFFLICDPFPHLLVCPKGCPFLRDCVVRCLPCSSSHKDQGKSLTNQFLLYRTAAQT